MVRKTCDGNGSEKRAVKSISSSSMNPSMSSLTSLSMGSVRACMRLGAKRGSRILRYFRCSGGSICSGISGRRVLRSTASVFDENTSGWRNTSSTAAREQAITPTPSIRIASAPSTRAM